jgi:class 3 adenylate cyclase
MPLRYPKVTYLVWALGALGLAAVVGATILDPPALTTAAILPLAVFVAAGFLSGLYQVRVATHNVVSICVAAFMGATLAFGPVVGAWLAAAVDFFITVVDTARVKRGRAAPPPPDIAPGRLLYNTGLNGAMFLAAGYAYQAFAGPGPLADVTPRPALGLLAFLVALELVNGAFVYAVQRCRVHLPFKEHLVELKTSAFFDLPLLPAAVALSLLYAHNLIWGLAGAGAFIVLASALLHRENRLDLVVNRYVSRAKSSKILANPYELLRPERRDISIVFCDLRGTTGIGQELEPADMLALLNEFHEGMIDEVARAGATVDKILGDGLMVLVGAPMRVEDHPARALQLAIAMHHRHRGIRARLKERGLPAPGMGAGIASGEVVIGNVGSELRLDYTAIGGQVNVASKLCAAAEEGEILISSACRERVEAALAAGRASYLGTVRFADLPPVTVARLAQPLRPVKAIFDDDYGSSRTS